MFDTPVSDLDTEGTLTRASHMEYMQNLLDAERLATAAHWADLHAVLDHSYALPGSEQLVQFGGDGTPEVAEFAVVEFGCAIGVSHPTAARLIGDALDLRHRLPMVWQRVQAGEVKAWAARRIAEAIRHLPKDAARRVDRVVAPYADRKAPSELVKIAEAEAIRVEPELARERAEAARRERGAWLSPEVQDGIGSMYIRGDAADLTRLDGGLDQWADVLGALGDETSKDERRAKAAGILADPQLALELHAQATGQEPVQRAGSGARQTTLYVHLTDETLRDADGVVRIERIGPALKSQVADWLHHDHVTIKPVIDLANQTSVDAYEIPDRLREAVHLLMPCDVFPYATSKSRRKDIDHTIPYDTRDPDAASLVCADLLSDAPASVRSAHPGARVNGRTGIGKLGPLARLSHRVKTHARWQVRQPFAGIFIWRSPHGTFYLVDHTGTRRLQTA